jgi:positive regulator of sigma E activity
MNRKIKHSGIIKSIGKDFIRVRIIENYACTECAVASHCNASDMKDKIVNIYNLDNIKDYRIDEAVIVTASTRIEFNAILLAFIIPLIIMVATLFIVASTTSDELLSAIASLFVLVPYYLVLYYNRGRIREKLSFEIER